MTQATVTNPAAPRMAHPRFRPAPLAASLALLWSGTSLAAPGEPVLDRSEPEYVLDESNPSANIAVSWQRFYGDPALTARYLLNDELVLTRAVETGDAAFEVDGQSGGATLSIDRAGLHEIAVELCNAEGCTESEPSLIDVWDAAADSAADPMASAEVRADVLSFEEAEHRFAEIDAILAPYATVDDLIQASVNDSWGSWLAGLVGQSVLKYGIGMGLDGLVNALGLGNRGPDLGQQLSNFQQSLDQMRSDLEGLAQQIDANHAEGLFHTTNTNVLTAMSKIRTVSRTIAGMEEHGISLTDGELGNLAYANSEAADLLQTFAEGRGGAVALMLDYYQLKYPVSSGIEVRELVDDYVDGVRAAFGAAVLNQAWLREARPDNQIYDDVEDVANSALDAILASVGAPYPQLSGGPSGFIHRAGTGWALIDAARPELEGEAKRKTVQNRGEIWNLFGSIAVDVDVPGALSVADYMDQNGVKRNFRDPQSVRIDHRDSFFECELWVRHDELYIAGNARHSKTHTTYNRKYACSFGAAKPWREAREEESRLKQTFGANEKAYTVDVQMNDWGLPALMDERSIESHRYGMSIDAIDRGQGNAVTVTYDKNGYDWLQVRNPQTGTVHYTGPNTDQTLKVGQAIAGGALELVQGHRVENREGEGSILVKERAVVIGNPKSTGMTLMLQPS